MATDTEPWKQTQRWQGELLHHWFAFEHLPEHLRIVSEPFAVLARRITETIAPGPERTVALRKLLEAKDAAVRAVVRPGG